MSFYKNPILGRYLHENSIAAKAWGRGPEQILVGYQQIQIGQQEVQVGEDDNHLPIYELQAIMGDDETRPIYEDGEELFELVWDDPENPGVAPTDAQLAAFDPAPVSGPAVTDVEIAKAEAKRNYLERREIRQANIDNLMVDVAFAMVASGDFTVDNVDEEGSEFIAAHGGRIYRYVMGGNKTAQDLYDAVVASKKNAEAPARAFPWLSDAILAIFSKALLGR